MDAAPRVAIVTLGCARNEVDSEDLAARLEAGGWVVADAGGEPGVDTDAEADVVLVNTCGFIAAAKKDSIDAILAAADSAGGARRVVAVGCLAERYGQELASHLPEASAVLGFDSYAAIDAQLRRVASGEAVESHAPLDRRKLLPIAPVERSVAGDLVVGTSAARRRLQSGPVAPLKIASGCDRRCTFCAIPTFRGSFASRHPREICKEAGWLVSEGVRELLLVSENSTSYGKDLGDARLATLLTELDLVVAHRSSEPVRIRLSYLQPAEIRDETIEAIVGTASVVDYFDLSFQHADPSVLRAMRRFGSAQDFLGLIERIRLAAPTAGIRSNVIVGFPGETDSQLQTLIDFLASARLDAVGVFGYSDEEGTVAASLVGKLPQSEIRARVDAVSRVAEMLMAERAGDRVGERVEVLVEEVRGAGIAVGRAAHQGPDDAEVTITAAAPTRIGSTVSARVKAARGVDLIASQEP